MRVIGWVVVLVLAVAAVLTLNPEWLGRINGSWAGLTTTYPLNQLVALRSLLALLFAAVAVVVLVVGLIRKVGFHGGTRTLVLGLVLAVVAVGHGWTLGQRGLDNPDGLPADVGVRPDGPGDGSLTVLAYNTNSGRTDADVIAAVARRTGADVLVLPEADRAVAEQVASFLAGGGETFEVFSAAPGEGGPPPLPDAGATPPEDPAAAGAPVPSATATLGGSGAVADSPEVHTSVLVSSTLGEYVRTEGPATRAGVVRVEPASGQGPVVVGVHLRAPTAQDTDGWAEELRAVRELCDARGPQGLILAGDLNATLDHRPLQDLGRCSDGAAAAGVGGSATWPARLPRLLGATIDHVIVDGSWEPTGALVADDGDGDHRGVVVRVRPAQQGSG